MSETLSPNSKFMVIPPEYAANRSVVQQAEVVPYHMTSALQRVGEKGVLSQSLYYSLKSRLTTIFNAAYTRSQIPDSSKQMLLTALDRHLDHQVFTFWNAYDLFPTEAEANKAKSDVIGNLRLTMNAARELYESGIGFSTQVRRTQGLLAETNS